MKCKICDTELKDLFTSQYCPNEDNHTVKAQEKSAIINDILSNTFLYDEYIKHIENVQKRTLRLQLATLIEANSVKEHTFRSSDLNIIEWIYTLTTYINLSLEIDFDKT